MQSLTLLQYNQLIKNLLYDPQVQGCWVTAETSDMRVSRGHCYMELIQKNDSGATVARLGAVMWASTYQLLDSKFFSVTGKHIATGMKVMVKVNANFHEQYGLKAVINDINPEFTLGDMARIRQEIIARLTAEGVIDMNRALEWPLFPNRVAVISAAGAAGYGDFINQLHGNPYGLKFYTALFQATMQGTNTVPSVIAALDRIAAHEELFDCVVIIRGGGSTSDLNSFDDYTLGANIAQFPLPVITGIGHDRDITIPDMVSKLHVKTPTAAAEFLVQCGAAQIARLDTLATTIITSSAEAVAHAREQLGYYVSFIPMAARKMVETSGTRLMAISNSIPLVLKARLSAENTRLQHNSQLVQTAVTAIMQRERMQLRAIYDKVQLLSPQNTLKRGYSLTVKDGHAVTNAAQLAPGDQITTHFASGTITSTVN